MLNVVARRLRRRDSIPNIRLEDLRRERIRLEQEESKLVRRSESLEKDKEILFQQGVDEISERRQIRLARKIKELDARGKGLERQLVDVNHQLRIVNGWLLIQEEVGTMARDETRLFAEIPVEQLASFVEEATVRGELKREHVADILKTMEDGVTVAEGMAGEEEEDIKEIVSIFQMAHSAVELDPTKAMETGLERVNHVLTRDH